ncbi:RICIN domain-containing protein [Nocardia sp. NPDC051570]|uniref:RICIN domain-containing protein n=1 Tax=Nocardia sp. NPDC051570 TaxID=3364324 RepID=UPI00379C82A5
MLCATAGISAAPAPAAPPADASPRALIQTTFTSVSNGNLLDVQDGTRDDGAPVAVNPAPGSATSWRINTGSTAGAGFAIVNATTDKCLDTGTLTYQLRQRPCDGRASEQWYFQPVSGSTSKAFRIRDVGANNCLTTEIPPGTDNWAYELPCDGTPYQQWTLPDEVYQAAWNAAVDYAAARCAKDTSTCSWTTTKEALAAPLPDVCVSPVWYNDTSREIPWTFTLTTSTGWSNKIGGSLSASLTVGSDMTPLKGVVTAEVHGETTLDLKQELGNSLTVTVPYHNYGWVTLSELATKVTGTWTFDTQGVPWTAEDTITVPLKHGPNGGASIYSAHTRTEFTSCSGTAA